MNPTEKLLICIKVNKDSCFISVNIHTYTIISVLIENPTPCDEVDSLSLLKYALRLCCEAEVAHAFEREPPAGRGTYTHLCTCIHTYTHPYIHFETLQCW